MNDKNNNNKNNIIVVCNILALKNSSVYNKIIIIYYYQWNETIKVNYIPWCHGLWDLHIQSGQQTG